MIPRAWKRREPGPGRCGERGAEPERGAAGEPRARPRPPHPAFAAESQSRAPAPSGDKELRSRRQVVGGYRGQAAGAGFVRLGLGGLRPAAFPRLCAERQSRGLRGHRRVWLGVPRPGAPPGASAEPLWVAQCVELGGGRARAAPSIRGWLVRSQRQRGQELTARE